jgi:hypothetical protein
MNSRNRVMSSLVLSKVLVALLGELLITRRSSIGVC